MSIKELWSLEETHRAITVGELIKVLSEIDKNSKIYVSVDGELCNAIEYDEEEHDVYIY